MLPKNPKSPSPKSVPLGSEQTGAHYIHSVDNHGDDTFTAHHKESLHEGEGGGHGGTEMGWLVSYADMMTLLFGLFVILFSITTDQTKNVNDIMMEVSNKYFSDQGGNSPVPASQPPTEPVPETPAPPIEPVDSASHAEAEKAEFAQQIEDLKKKVVQLESETKRSKREPASTNFKKQIESLNQEVAQTKTESQKIQSELEKKIQENEELKEQINKSVAQNYLMVLVTWETEKHDIDLEITNTHKKVFNFKKRKIASEDGSFEIDSRFGPGIEMWKTENFKPGNYKAKLSLYNKNGNEAPAQVQLTIVTNLNTYKTAPIVLDTNKKQKEVRFAVEKDGAVRFEE